MLAPPWARRIRDYIGPIATVGTPGDSDARGMAELEKLRRCASPPRTWPKVPCPDRPDLDLRQRNGRHIAALCAKTGEILGAITDHFPFVRPDVRGRGVASELYQLLDIQPVQPVVGAYTESGMMARVAAHRLHIVRATRRGDHVPREVRADYRMTDAGLRLVRPYGVAMHNAWVAEHQREERERRYLSRTGHFTTVFRSEGEMNHPDFVNFDPAADGYALAIHLHRTYGGELVVGGTHDEIRVHALIDGQLVDCDGIRDFEAEKASDTGRRTAWRWFQDVPDLLKWMQPGDPFGYLPNSSPFDESLVREAADTLPAARIRDRIEAEHRPSPAPA